MAELRTEEEQIQAIKDWWKRNGTSLLIGVGAALAIVFGWQGWQNHQAQERAAAGNQFANLVEAFSNQDDENRSATVAFIAETLRDKYSDSAYAVYGNLILARQQLTDGDVDGAVATLEWSRDKAAEHPALSVIVDTRLARAKYAGGNYDDALAVLDSIKDAGSFTGIVEELRGDILLAKGDSDGARTAYLRARDALALTGGTAILELKLSDLGVGEDA